LILRVNGKQKCQILATQLGNVEKTLAIFSILAKEYAAKTLSENDFYRRRDELVEEHGQVVDPEGAEEGGQEGHGAEASQRPTRKAMKAMKSKKAMKLENATMAQDASERPTGKAMKAMKSKPIVPAARPQRDVDDGAVEEPAESPPCKRRVVTKAESDVHAFISKRMQLPF